MATATKTTPAPSIQSFASIASLISGYSVLLKVDHALSSSPRHKLGSGAGLSPAALIAQDLTRAWASAKTPSASDSGFPSIQDALASLAASTAMFKARQHKDPSRSSTRSDETPAVAKARIAALWGTDHWHAKFSWDATPLATLLEMTPLQRESIGGHGGLFEIASAALSELVADPARIDPLAEALCGHLATAYSKNGVDGLAIPLMSSGLRKSRFKVNDKYIASASAWTSSGGAGIAQDLDPDAIPTVATGYDYSSNPGDVYGHNLHITNPHGEKLSESYLAIEDNAQADVEPDLALDVGVYKSARSALVPDTMGFIASQIFFSKREAYGGTFGRLGFQALRSGAHLAGHLELLRTPENTLPCVESARADRNLWGGFVWSMAGTAAMRACGDSLGLDSLSRFGAMPLRVAMSSLAQPHVPPTASSDALARSFAGFKGSWGLLSQQASANPIAFAAGLAMELARANSGDSEPDLLLAQQARLFLTQAKASFDKVAEAAYSKALERQRSWMESQGLASGWAAASEIDRGKSAPSSKSLAWAVANPEARAQAAQGGPVGAFCVSIARAFGARANPANAIAESVIQTLAAKGLSKSSLAWAVDHGLDALLKDSADKALLTRGKEQMEAWDRLDCACLFLEQGALRDIDPSTVRECFATVLNSRSHWLTGNDSIVRAETLARSMCERELDHAGSAQDMAAQARAKTEKIGWLIGRMLDAFSSYKTLAIDGSDGPGCPKIVDAFGAAMAPDYRHSPDRSGVARFSSPQSAADQRMARELLLFESVSMGPLDWVGLDVSHGSWLEAALRRPASLCLALRDAESSSDQASEIAALCAPALGIESAASGNELAGRVRDELMARWGMSPAAWKAFLKMPREMILSVCATLSSTEPELAVARAKAREQQTSRGRRGDAMGAFQGAWLSAMSALHIEPALVMDMIGLAIESEAGGWKGFYPLKDWGPFVPPQKQGSAEGAQFYLDEVRAKAARLPWVAKAVCSRLKTLRDARLAGPEWASQGAWPSKPGSFETKAAQAAQAALCEEWSQISDWINKSENGLWQALPEKITWGQMWRAQADWHTEAAASSAGGSRGWPTALPRLDKGDWQAVDLNNASMLVEEGREMRHCVSSYASTCRKGQSRIFSVRFAGSRVCTLQLAFKNAQGAAIPHADADEGVQVWIAQNKGLLNQAVTDPSTLALCEEVRSEYQKVWRAAILKRKAEEASKAKERRVAKKNSLVIDGSTAPKALKNKPRP